MLRRIIPVSNNLPDASYLSENWKKLSFNEKKLESKKMEIYAGMIENMVKCWKAN